MKADNSKAQMRKGVLELCILAIIDRETEMYPSDIIGRLKESELIVVEGTLYPLLTRLKNDGLLQYTWRESRSGPPRKYFQLTDEGKEFLADLKVGWDELVAAVNTVAASESLPRPLQGGETGGLAPGIDILKKE